MHRFNRPAAALMATASLAAGAMSGCGASDEILGKTVRATQVLDVGCPEPKTVESLPGISDSNVTVLGFTCLDAAGVRTAPMIVERGSDGAEGPFMPGYNTRRVQIKYIYDTGSKGNPYVDEKQRTYIYKDGSNNPSKSALFVMKGLKNYSANTVADHYQGRTTKYSTP